MYIYIRKTNQNERNELLRSTLSQSLSLSPNPRAQPSWILFLGGGKEAAEWRQQKGNNLAKIEDN